MTGPAAGIAVRMQSRLALLIGLALRQACHAASKDLERGLGAVAGVFAGICIHELGHAAAFRAAGAEEIHI